MINGLIKDGVLDNEEEFEYFENDFAWLIIE